MIRFENCEEVDLLADHGTKMAYTILTADSIAVAASSMLSMNHIIDTSGKIWCGVCLPSLCTIAVPYDQKPSFGVAYK